MIENREPASAAHPAFEGELFLDEDGDFYLAAASVPAGLINRRGSARVALDARLDDGGATGEVTLAVDDGARHLLMLAPGDARTLAHTLLRAAELAEFLLVAGDGEIGELARRAGAR